MSVKINVNDENAGAVELVEGSQAHPWASYGVHDNLFYAGITMKDGHSVQFFVNRESGLVCVDYHHKNEKGGNELLRTTLNAKQMLKHCK